MQPKPRQPASESGPRAGASAPPRPPRRSWFSTHGRDLRFLLIFAFLMGLYYLASTTDTMKSRFFPWYLRVNADVSVRVLNGFGYDGVSLAGTYLKSARGSISVERGCDAVEPTALFAAAVLASPVPLLSKIPAVFAGAIFLAVVNVIRIISLFLSAAHWRAAFDILHLDVWQAAFIILALLMWLLWAAWATKRQKRRAGV